MTLTCLPSSPSESPGFAKPLAPLGAVFLMVFQHQQNILLVLPFCPAERTRSTGQGSRPLPVGIEVCCKP